MPTQNVGTLVGAAIRPIDDAMPIASAFSFEINGGHHQVATLVARDAIIVQRRQWGMLCTVYNDSTSTNNATYQLKYGYNSTNTMDNANWVVFSGGAAGGGGSSNWVDPVLSVTMSTPGISADGDRYLVGLDENATLSGSFASLTNTGYVGNLVGGYISEYKSSISSWVTTLPTDGMTLRVNDQDNSFYRYEGTYSTGQWYKERVNQVRYLSASSVNGVNYTITTNDFFEYSTEVVYLVQFGTANSGSTASLNINGLGQKTMRKQNALGLTDFSKNDINEVSVYKLVYDGTIFRLVQEAGEGGAFTLKYRIIDSERIEVPAYSEYLLYGDLEVNGILDISATGKVVIVNGGLNVNGGTVSNSGNIEFVTVPIGAGSLSSVLLNGNTTGGNGIISHTPVDNDIVLGTNRRLWSGDGLASIYSEGLGDADCLTIKAQTPGSSTYSFIDFNSNGGLTLSAGSFVSNASIVLTGPLAAGAVGPKVNLSPVLNLAPGSQPATASAGDIYFDSGINKLRAYDGSSWNNLW